MSANVILKSLVVVGNSLIPSTYVVVVYCVSTHTYLAEFFHISFCVVRDRDGSSRLQGAKELLKKFLLVSNVQDDVSAVYNIEEVDWKI